MTKQVQTQTTSSGIGISTVLVIVFLVLKLVGVIDWSWWWVFSPWWITGSIICSFFLITLLVVGVIFTVIGIKDKKK